MDETKSSELWEKLLVSLDDKLQLGLLEHLRRVASYTIEGGTLIIVPFNKADFDYLHKSAVLQQLHLLAEDAIGVNVVNISEVK